MKKQKNIIQNWPEIPDHPYRILIITGSGSRKTNVLFSIINQQPDVDKIYFYTKGLNEAKYEFLFKKPGRCWNKAF